jgi:hypothetical protein
MPELQSCYFCGEIGDALTAFDVVPADLADESTQQTVVVCSTCHRKLDTLLAPLRALAVEGGGVEERAVGHGTGEPDSGGGVETSDTPESADDADQSPTTDDADQSPTTDSSDQPVEAESPLTPSDSAEESSETATADDESAGGSADDHSADDIESGGITFGGTAADSATDGTEEPLLGGADEETTAEPEGETEKSPDDTEERTDTASDDSAEKASSGASDDPPTGYRKVVRLLQNRAFPVERESFTDLASNAYELDESDVAASLDRLVERGALVESGGELQKP